MRDNSFRKAGKCHIAVRLCDTCAAVDIVVCLLEHNSLYEIISGVSVTEGHDGGQSAQKAK